jgi:putative sterol carrier protein
LQAAAQDRGERAFRGFVQHSGDRVLERTAGSGPGLRLVFTAMAHQFDPDKAKGFSGEIHYELRRADGSTAPWTVVIANGGAAVRPGASDDPALTLKLTVADFLRIAGQDLDPGVALLTGRLDLEGDFSLAMRLGEMFGQ